jgi:hypothetical protein
LLTSVAWLFNGIHIPVPVSYFIVFQEKHHMVLSHIRCEHGLDWLSLPLR